ncbi:MAG: hypothetical protein RL660_580 [Bacteroidota bacterium]|jgi:gliding motility-associated-like protein
MYAQQITFQKLYTSQGTASSLRTFDGKQVIDGGYVCTGVGNFSNVTRPFIQKCDCKGKFLWGKYFAPTSGANNIFMKVIETTDSHIVLMTNTGTFMAYNILIAKFDLQGNTIWKKVINTGIGNDFGQSIKPTKDGGYIICGGTNSYGTELVGGNFSDVYVIKLDPDANVEWTKTFGNAGAIDDAKDIIELKQGGYALTGSYINQECFKVFYANLDSLGNVNTLRVYGDTLSRNNGYVIQQDAAGDLFIFATTTMRAPIPNFNGDVDHWLLKINIAGDTLWTRAFNGTSNDGSDNSLSMCFASNGNLVLGTETMSYPSTGFTPNKQVSHRFDAAGNLLQSTGYNTTGSQYTRIHPAKDGGYTLTGFSTIGINTSFRTNIFKLDSALHSGCFENDLTSLTNVGVAPMFIKTAPYTSLNGFVIANNTFEGTYTIVDTVLCESFPLPNAAFTLIDTVCVGTTVTATMQEGYAVYAMVWQGTDTIQSNSTATHTFTAPGVYTVTAIVSNGCELATSTQVIVVTATPAFNIIATPNPAYWGQTVTLSTNEIGSNYLWSNSSTSNTIAVQDSGWYSVNANINGCAVQDSIFVQLLNASDTGYIYLPNAFTPNGDGDNDQYVYFVSPNYTLVSLSVYNRWGTQLFRTETPGAKWDGFYKGSSLDMDTYYVIALFSDNIKNKVVTIKQNVVLLR